MWLSIAVTFGILGAITAPGLIAQQLEKRKTGKVS